MISKGIFYLIFLCFVCFSCDQKNGINHFSNLGINSQEWKNDTFGCNSYRYGFANKLGRKSEDLNLSMDDCLLFFGAPNIRRKSKSNEEIFLYYCQPSLYCTGNVSVENMNQLDIITLFLKFGQNRNMVDFGVKMP